MEEDDWGLSMEELDSLEQAAARQVAERQRSSSLASTILPSPSSPPLPSSSSSSSSSRRHIHLLRLKFSNDSQRPERIAVETQYDPHLISTLKSVSGHEWDQQRRVWTFPEAKIEDLLGAVSKVNHIPVTIDVVPPLSLPTVQVQGISQMKSPEKVNEEMLQTSPQKSFTARQDLPKSPLTKRSLTITVQISMLDLDTIIARNPYHEKIKEACQSVTGRSWNTSERAWTFPRSSFEELVDAIMRIPSALIAIEAVPPLMIPESVLRNTACSQSEVAPAQVDSCSGSRIQPQPEILKPSSQPFQDSAMQRNLPKVSAKFCLHSSGCIAVRCDYQAEVVAALKSVTQSKWHPGERLWVFPLSSSTEAEEKLLKVEGAIVNLEQLDPLVCRALKAASTCPDLQEKYSSIPQKLETGLLPFQREGVRFALQHGGRVLIADEMGLGKTLQAIAFASCFQDDWPVLVIAPSSLRLHWAATIHQWLDIQPIDIVVVMSTWAGSNPDGFRIVQTSGKNPARLDGLFNIISYELVTKLQDEIGDADFKIVIADESHYLKNAQAKRTNACVPILQRSKYALLLTGTPALSRPVELFKQALQPSVYKNLHEYGKRYCMGGVYGVYQGCSNCEELHTLVVSTLMVRRLKKDVLPQLPQKRRQQIFLSLDEKGLKQMRAITHELEMIKWSISNCGSPEEAEKLKYSQKQLISKMYNDTAEYKLPAVVDYLSTVIEADCKFLIFAYHQIMLDGIDQFLQKKKVGFIRIDGSTPASSRMTLVSKFQDQDNVKAAVLGIRAAGVGLTLTAASTVIFAELSWTPGELVQAEDRAHRIGQESSVNVYYLLAHESADNIIWETVQHKLENVGQVLDGKEDALHVSASQRHHRLPQGQSTLKAFLCSSNSVSPKRNSDSLLQPCLNSASPKKRKQQSLFNK